MIIITRIEDNKHHGYPQFRAVSKKYGAAILSLDGDGNMRIRSDGATYLTFNGVSYSCDASLRTLNKYLRQRFEKTGRPDDALDGVGPSFNPKAPQIQEYKMRDFRDVHGTRANWTDYAKAGLSAAARRQFIAFAEQAAEIVVREHQGVLFEAEAVFILSLIKDQEKKHALGQKMLDAATAEMTSLVQRAFLLGAARLEMEEVTA